jgi:hypothetical protein
MNHGRIRSQFWPVLFALVLPAASHAAPETLWLYRYGPLAGAFYHPLASFVDDTGNVSVVGWVEPDDTSGNRDVVLFKVDSMGNRKWDATYANATAAAAASDTSGNIYIACGIRGVSTRGEFCLLKYRPDGSREMAQVYGQPERLHRWRGARLSDDRRSHREIHARRHTDA